jgi:hypothetical protein
MQQRYFDGVVQAQGAPTADDEALQAVFAEAYSEVPRLTD